MRLLHFPSIKRIPLKSTSLASAGYNLRTRVLEIEFRTGAVYQYQDVPAGEYVRFMDAESHGNYFTRNIRDVYEYKRVA